MAPGAGSKGEPSGSKKALYIEDLVIFLAIAVLFVLGVFFREELWAQVALVVVLVVMIVVGVSRLRRVHRAFMGRDD